MEVRDAYRIIQNSERRRDYDDIKKSSIRFSEAFKAAEEFGTNYTKTEDMIRKMGQKAYQHRHSYGQGPKSKEDILVSTFSNLWPLINAHSLATDSA